MNNHVTADNSAEPDVNRVLKVALACPGVGLVQRGFERFFYDLFVLLESNLEITLYKGGGEVRANQVVLKFAPRNGWVPKVFPIHKLFGRTPIHTECLTFAIALLDRIRKDNIDVVHCIDPPLARVLYKLRYVLGLKFRLLYSEGCAMPPGDYPPADHVHQVAKVTYDAAQDYGFPPSYMSLVPCGIYPERFISNKSRQALRREYDISDDVFVILSVAAINRNHKRIDYLIEEASKLRGNFLLWIDGSLDQGDPELIDAAKEKLDRQCKITHVSSEKVGDLFRLADVMVHCSLFESFGLAIVEGASTGLPVITHNSSHFQWLLPEPKSWVNMQVPGELSTYLQSVTQHRDKLKDLSCAETIKDRFAWRNLKSQYIDLYHHVAKLEVGCCPKPVKPNSEPA